MPREDSRRAALASRLAALRREQEIVRAEYEALGGYERSPALLEFSVGGVAVAVAAADVEEVVPMVRLSPLPGCHYPVIGAFHHRGVAAVAVEVSGLVGDCTTEPDVLVVLGGEPRVALAADSVEGIVTDARREVSGGDSLQASLVGGLARTGDRVMPVLEADRVRAVVYGGELPVKEGA